LSWKKIRERTDRTGFCEGGDRGKRIVFFTSLVRQSAPETGGILIGAGENRKQHQLSVTKSGTDSPSTKVRKREGGFEVRGGNERRDSLNVLRVAGRATRKARSLKKKLSGGKRNWLSTTWTAARNSVAEVFIFQFVVCPLQKRRYKGGEDRARCHGHRKRNMGASCCQGGALLAYRVPN